MNKTNEKEIKKIPVKDGQELIAEAKKYQNSGGQWRLQKKYLMFPDGTSETKTHLGKWGIVISNGEQEVEICSLNNTVVDGKEPKEWTPEIPGISTVNIIDEKEVRQQLIKIFPEVEPFSWNEKGPALYLTVKEGNESYHRWEYLVAWTLGDIQQAFYDFCEKNGHEIIQSTTDFANWVKMEDDGDDNYYIYLGNRKNITPQGGKGIKIGVKKTLYDSKKYKWQDNGDQGRETNLKVMWNFACYLSLPRTPEQERKYYFGSEGLEENWQLTERHWKEACRSSLESVRGELKKKLEYLNKLPVFSEKEALAETLQRIAKVDNRLMEIKSEQPNCY